MRPIVPLAVATALLAAGCLSANLDAGESPIGTPDGQTPITPVRERADLSFATDGTWSRVLDEGAFGVLPALSVTVPFDVALGQGLPEQTVHMGVFLPEIDGCDWEAAEVPEACRVPVVADVGPYYGEPVLGDVHATEPADRLGGSSSRTSSRTATPSRR